MVTRAPTARALVTPRWRSLQCLLLVFALAFLLVIATSVSKFQGSNRQLRTASDSPDDPRVSEHHGETDIESSSTATVAIGVISGLVLLSILFEVFTESLRDSTDEMNMPFINTIFSELTTLGFIGLVLFIITKLEILSTISRQLLGDEKHLHETIEVLHMGLFLFIIIFLVLCVGLLKLGTAVQNEWREFERSSNDIPAVVTEYVLATEPPSRWKDRFSLARRSAARKCHREMVYLALRRRFVDYRSNHPDEEKALEIAKEFQLNPDVRFPFNEYLSLISGEVMGRLIQVDLPTWITLEVILAGVLGVCHAVGKDGEVYVLLGAGFLLILLNEISLVLIRRMRYELTPPQLMRDAERLRGKPEWRTRHQLPPSKPSVPAETVDGDDLRPQYLARLPEGGEFMTEHELADAQRSLLLSCAGKNGVRLTLFCTRLVFLLTALHLSVFLMRTMHQIYKQHHGNWTIVVVLYIAFLLPSVLVTSMSVKIARDGLYAFNVEHMKAERAITRVMRVVKARQTLRTLRFVVEMKIYLRENIRRKSSLAGVYSVAPLPSSLSSSTLSKVLGRKPSLNRESHDMGMRRPTPSAKAATTRLHEPRMSLAQARRMSVSLDLAHVTAVPASSKVEPPLSPLAAYYTPRDQRSEAYRIEQERREIHTIFCLFDVDGSGSISRDEMANLLRTITHDLSDDQLNLLMKDLLAGRPRNHFQKGEISFESFYNWCHQHIQENAHSKEELIHEIFRMIDVDDNGFITVDEFIRIFKTLGQSLDHDDVRELVYQMDRNDDGKIDLEEFTKMLQKHEI